MLLDIPYDCHLKESLRLSYKRKVTVQQTKRAKLWLVSKLLFEYLTPLFGLPGLKCPEIYLMCTCIATLRFLTVLACTDMP